MENLASKVYENTLKWAKNVGVKTEKPELSEDQKKWKEFFSKNGYGYGGQKFTLALVSELSGVDLSPLQKDRDNFVDVKYLFGICIVPCANYNSHNYEIGKPIICENPSHSYFMRSNGTTGNHLGNSVNIIRLPSLEQVEKILKSIKTKNRSFYSKLVSHYEDNNGKPTNI